MTDAPPAAPSIRSYVLRAGRMTDGQQRALTLLWPRFGVAADTTPVDLEALFGRRAPVVLEIGFGNGEHLLARAQAEPGTDFIGIEVHRPGVGHLLLAADRAGVANLRVFAHDAVQVLDACLAAHCLDEVQILFPDPWPKARHHKRRLIQRPFIDLLGARLKIGGRLHLATDWAPYAQWMDEVMAGASGWERLSQEPEARAATRFERRGQRLGHTISECFYRRLPEAAV